MEEENYKSLRIIEVSSVTPPPESIPSASAPTSLPLTFFDILWLRFHPIQRLFFYENKTITQKIFTETIIPKLKHSLSVILQHYLPLAGTLVWPQDSIPTLQFFQGDGVKFTVAESDDDFYRLSGNGFRDVTDYHPLLSSLTMTKDSISPISIQVTLFREMGFSIGVNTHHAVMDGRSSTSFMKSWARICSSTSDMIEPMPLLDRTVINDNHPGLAAIYANDWMNEDGPNNKSLIIRMPKTEPGSIRCTLEFTRENLQKLKKWVSILNPTLSNQISSFAVATAYLCYCEAKSGGFTHERMIGLGIPGDARPRLKPPVPETYFGNCLTACLVSFEISDLLKENGAGLAIAAEAISKSIKKLGDNTLDGVEKWCYYMISSLSNEEAVGEVKVFGTSGSPRFGVYETDFGWGKPRKVEIVSIDSSKAFGLCESKNGDGGMEIGIVGKPNKVNKFTTIFSQGLESL